MAYVAVGMMRALDWSIGLPRSSISALWMLLFLIPAELRSSFIQHVLGYLDIMNVGNIKNFGYELRPTPTGDDLKVDAMAPSTPSPLGSIILLNGASSSGKGSIANELLDLLDPPHFLLSVDAFNAMRSKEKTRLLSASELDGVMHQTRAGFHRAVGGMAFAGNSVVMDYVLSEPWRLHDCLEVFDGLRVVFVGVRCELEVLESRERMREDRVLGTAASQVDIVHSFGPYDIEVWTDQMTPREAASHIAISLPGIGATTAFDRLRST
jgi:chloramphenicol 3-O phosphotransferase